MIIYKDRITEDEMFTDAFKIIDRGVLYEVEGKTVTRKSDDIDDSLIGGNASAEEVAEGVDSSSERGVDIVLNHKLKQTGFDKKTYITYIKGYVKTIKAKLEESNPERVKEFQPAAEAEVKKILSKFKDYEFFTGNSMNPDGMVGLLDFREDGKTPFMLFFKDGLIEEKC